MLKKLGYSIMVGLLACSVIAGCGGGDKRTVPAIVAPLLLQLQLLRKRLMQSSSLASIELKCIRWKTPPCSFCKTETTVPNA